MNERLYKNWGAVKEFLLDGLDEDRKQVLDVLIDNTRRKTDPKFLIIILPTLRRIMETDLFEIVGVQALPHCYDEVQIGENAFEIIETSKQKLSTAFSLDVDEETRNDAIQKGIDIDAEIMSCMTQEFMAEIEQNIIRKYKNSSNIDYINSVNSDEILINIENRINEISSDNKWIIISPTILTILKNSEKFEKNETLHSFSLKYIGKFANAKVIVDAYASYMEPVVFGYKNSNADAPAIYAPYVMIDFEMEKDLFSNAELCYSYSRYGYLDMGVNDKIKLLKIDTGIFSSGF